MAPTDDQTYQLYYWPSIPGRGEFVRLGLEEAEVDYRDVARDDEDDGGGVQALRELLDGDLGQTPGFAPPMLRHGELVISQTANICLYLARRHDLAGESEADELHANQLQLTMQDFLTEAHDTHHPISVAEYYEDQKEAAKQRASFFVSERIPKFFGYFERAAQRVEGPHLVGDRLTWADLSIFQILRGIEYAFPNAFDAQRDEIPGLLALADHVAGRPNIAAYLESDRRLDFNEHGIFRHYPELDA